MKEITYKDFENRKFNADKISNFKLTNGTCTLCQQTFEYSMIKKFLRNRIRCDQKYWSTCQKCFLKLRTVDSPEWIEKNSQAQLIAQNKPEQKIKNANGVSKSWTPDRKQKASENFKNRFANDPIFREKMICNPKVSSKLGGLKGYYNNIKYDSALELSFIMWCEHNSIPIKKYDLDPMHYIDENNEHRSYFPDFIINDCDIIEIKGLGWFYHKNYKRNICKMQYAKKQFSSYKVLFDSDECLKTFYKVARKWHHENQK